MTQFLQSRELVRAQPYRTQYSFAGAVADGHGFTAFFDVSLVVSDRNQLSQATVLAALPSVGPFLDVTVYSDAIGTLDIQVQTDAQAAASLHSVLTAPLAIVAGTPLVVSKFRITARFVYVVYLNTSGGAVNTEIGAYVGSA